MVNSEFGRVFGPRSAGARSIAATFVTLGLTYGVWYGYSVFIVALLREFGWSRSLLAGAFSVFALVHGILSPVLGWLGDRIGPRRLQLFGGIVLAAALCLDGTVSRPWHLYLTFGVLTSLGVACAGLVPAVILVQGWYPRRVGTALGVVSAGVGTGIFLVVPACQALIDEFGWRQAFRVLGIVAGCWIIPATVFLVRNPIDRSARASQEPEHQGAATSVPAPGPGVDVALRDALRGAPFWLLATAQFYGNFVCQMLLVHQVAYLVDHGIPALMAASVAGAVGLASILSRIGGGWLSDVAGRLATYTFGMVCVLVGIGMLGVVALVPGALPAFAYGLLVGVGYAVTVPLMPAVISDFFTGRHFGAIFGALHLANALGGAAGAWIAGRVFDAFGSYAGALAAAAVAGIVATASLWVAEGARSR